MGFGVWGGLQWIGNGCGIQIDGFSAQTEPYGSIFSNFHDFGDFGIVFGGLRKVPGPSETALKVPGPFKIVLWWSDAASGRSQDPLEVP